MNDNQTNPESNALPLPKSAFRITVEDLETGETDTFEAACAAIVQITGYDFKKGAECRGRSLINAPRAYWLALVEALKSMAIAVNEDFQKTFVLNATEDK